MNQNKTQEFRIFSKDLAVPKKLKPSDSSDLSHFVGKDSTIHTCIYRWGVAENVHELSAITRDISGGAQSRTWGSRLRSLIHLSEQQACKNRAVKEWKQLQGSAAKWDWGLRISISTDFYPKDIKLHRGLGWEKSRKFHFHRFWCYQTGSVPASRAISVTDRIFVLRKKKGGGRRGVNAVKCFKTH